MPTPDELWKVFEYECWMFLATRRLHPTLPLKNGRDLALKNALAESMLLHTRIVVDVLTRKAQAGSGRTGEDITVDMLLPESQWPPRLSGLLAKLKQDYGSATQQNTPCWTINKHLAHPTTHRSDYYDWGPTLNCVDGTIYEILGIIATTANREAIKSFLIDPFLGPRQFSAGTEV